MSRMDTLRIAGITFVIHCDDERVLWQWEEPASRFLVSADDAVADVELSVRLLDRTFGQGELLFDSNAVWRLFHDTEGYRIECRSEAFGDEPYKIALFNESFTRGTIYVREAVAGLNPLDYPLDEVLVANLLGRGRGVELHSCGVVDGDGRGHVFAGVSGAGKTTTAHLWAEDASVIVSDDRVIVREQDGAFWMYGTPWHGEAELSVAGGAPLAGVYLLEHAGENELRSLSDGDAVARLFRCSFPLFYDAGALNFTLAFLARIAATVPVRELRFVRDRSVIDLIRREAA